MSHVSFSALKTWSECPYKHKLSYVDRLPGFQGNEYTAFGTAIHDTCEKMLVENLQERESFFRKRFEETIKELPESIELRQDLIQSMRQQGESIIPHVLPALEDYFGEYEVLEAEEALFEDIREFEVEDVKFKGYIDLVIKTSDGKFHIIDWKTCSWGWNAKKRSDKMVTYQLTFYKYYYAKKHNIDLKNIETHFALLKRTAKSNKVEIFRVTSGNIKTNNAINFLKKALYNITNKIYLKNRLACNSCDFYKTEHCT